MRENIPVGFVLSQLSLEPQLEAECIFFSVYSSIIDQNTQRLFISYNKNTVFSINANGRAVQRHGLNFLIFLVAGCFIFPPQGRMLRTRMLPMKYEGVLTARARRPSAQMSHYLS